ncbi:wax ester synthase/diacylglycerol acyltransferase 8-like [Acropora millepora]|uniref:wax ester synthase/diacylglycerol acyltransferase 8-like n=1 Tax=Acropora millepora TaxID=45264 RepID=UPI001CF1E49F|nr:wax ester synthase/diacylglycerol acyltransferase 8-like [Acropora millepora]
MDSVYSCMSSAWLVDHGSPTCGVPMLFLVFFAFFFQFFVWFYIFKITERVIARMVLGEQYLNALDSLWVPHRQNLFFINAVYCFENEDSFDERVSHFRQVFWDRMVNAKKANGELLYPRFRCLIRPGLFQYFFREDQSFKIENHVFAWEGEVPRTKEELRAIVSKLNTEPFPEARSPWSFVCIPTNFGNNDVILLLRISHTLGDGVSLIKLLTYSLPDQVVPQKDIQNYSATRKTLHLAKAMFIAPLYLLKWFLRPADQSILHGAEVSGLKKFTWNESYDLQLIKDIKSAAGSTVNDILMSCFTMALRKYFQRKGIDNPKDLTACLAVDIRAPTKELSCDNQFTFIFPKMATATKDIIKQVNETQARMGYSKASGESLVTASFLSLGQELLPHFLTSKVNAFLSDKATCVFSNVPGPQRVLSMRGSRMKYMIFFPPLKEHLGFGLSIFSYAGRIIVGVQSDVSVLPDPEMVLEEFGNAVKEMTAKYIGHGNGTVATAHS